MAVEQQQLARRGLETSHLARQNSPIRLRHRNKTRPATYSVPLFPTSSHLLHPQTHYIPSQSLPLVHLPPIDPFTALPVVLSSVPPTESSPTLHLKVLHSSTIMTSLTNGVANGVDASQKAKPTFLFTSESVGEGHPDKIA